MRAGQAGTALGLGRLGRSSNCSSFIYHQEQGADRTYRAVLIGNHDLPLYRISHPPRVVPTPGTIPRYKPLTMHEPGRCGGGRRGDREVSMPYETVFGVTNSRYHASLSFGRVFPPPSM